MENNYKFLRSAILRLKGMQEQINIFCAYNGKMNNTKIAELSHKLHQELIANGLLEVPFEDIVAWVEQRFSFSQYNHPETNAIIEKRNGWFNYKTDSSSGGVKLENLVLLTF